MPEAGQDIGTFFQITFKVRQVRDVDRTCADTGQQRYLQEQIILILDFQPEMCWDQKLLYQILTSNIHKFMTYMEPSLSYSGT